MSLDCGNTECKRFDSDKEHNCTCWIVARVKNCGFFEAPEISANPAQEKHCCRKWGDGLSQINRAFEKSLLNGGDPSTVDVFKFCPWCGAEVVWLR